MLDVDDNCPRGALEWTSNDSNDIDNDGCDEDEDSDLDGDLIPNEAQPYFSQGYKLLGRQTPEVVGFMGPNLIHCIAQDNPRLTDVERPYVITSPIKSI